MSIQPQHLQPTPPKHTALTHAAWISGIALLLGLVFNYFFYVDSELPLQDVFYDIGFALSFPLYIALIVVSLLLLSRWLKRPLPRQVYLLLVPLFFFGIMTCLRDSELLTTLNVIAVVALLLLIASISTDTGRALKEYIIKDYLGIVLVPIKLLRPFFEILRHLRTLQRHLSQDSTTTQIIRGVIFTIPALLAFAVIFSVADPIFDQQLTKFIRLPNDLIGRIIQILFVACIGIGFFSFVLRASEHEKASHTADTATAHSRKWLGPIEISILLGSMNVLFFLFILIQLQYLFGGETTITVENLTYAEYARRGFLELIFAAILSFVLLRGTEKAFQSTTKARSRLFQFFSAALILQVFVIIASSFKRLFLYEQAFGFTTLRLYSHAFSVWLAILFLLWLWTIVIRKNERIFACCAFISIMLFLVAMNILNPDAFIAQRNLERSYVGKELDVDYLFSLSADAIPYQLSLVNTTDEKIRKRFEWFDIEIVYPMSQTTSMHWYNWHLTRMNAYRLIQQNKTELDQYRHDWTMPYPSTEERRAVIPAVALFLRI